MATTLQLECPGFWNEAVREKEEWHLKKGKIQIFFTYFQNLDCPVPMTCRKKTKNLDLGLGKEAVRRKEGMDTDHDG